MANSSSNEISSLQYLDNQRLMDAWDVFSENDKRFTSLSNEIFKLHDSVGDYWKGKAYDLYNEKFDLIFSQVRDIGDALVEISDALKEAFATYYETDDSLAQQLKEASYNSQKQSGSGQGSASGDTNYKQLQKKTPLYSTIAEAYIPDLTYPALPRRSVLVSTMGAAYKPNLGYAAMSPKPVLSSCLPSATVLNLIYKDMQKKNALTSCIGDALKATIDYMELARREALSSTIENPYEADMSYPPLSQREVLSSTIGAPYTADLSYALMSAKAMDLATLTASLEFLLDYSRASGGLQQLKSAMMAAQVNQIVIESLANSRSGTETANLIGEAIVGKVYGNIDDNARTQLVKLVGGSVYQQMYGRAPDAAIGVNGHIDWIDSSMEKTDLSMLKTVVGDIQASGILDADRSVSGVRTASGTALVPKLTLITGNNNGTSVTAIVGTVSSAGNVATDKINNVLGKLANYENAGVVERSVISIASQQSGASSIFPVNPTKQIVSTGAITITAGQTGITVDTLRTITSGNMTASASSNINTVVNQWSQTAVQFSFEGIRYPRPTFPGALSM